MIVHQEPVGKSKSSSDSQPSKRRRGSNSKSDSNKVATHEITDDTRNAIAKIAATTVSNPPTESIPVISEADLAPASGVQAPEARAEKDTSLLDSVLNALPEAPEPGKGRRRRRASSQGIVTPDAGSDA